MHLYTRQDTEGLMVEALCADYGRRARLMSCTDTPKRTRIECRYINTRLYDAIRALCSDDEEAMLFLREIGLRRGYATSETTLGETAYKQKKCEIRRQILIGMHLI